jgi:hypothetical protein
MTEPPKKVTSERGISDLDGQIADQDVVDAELIFEDDPPLPPPQPPQGADDNGEDNRPCLYCRQPQHTTPITDRFKLACPGEGGSVKAIQKYLMMREFCEDQELIDNLDTTAMGQAAKDAYRTRKRSNVTHAELQADINARLGRLGPKMKLRENLTSDGPDLEVPHITTPGKTPIGGSVHVGSAENLIGGKRPERILTQKEQAQKRSQEVSRLHTASTDVSAALATPLPKDQEERKYDQMMFINKTENRP